MHIYRASSYGYSLELSDVRKLCFKARQIFYLENIKSYPCKPTGTSFDEKISAVFVQVREIKCLSTLYFIVTLDFINQ